MCKRVRHLFKLWCLFPIVHLSRAGASTSVYKFDNVVRGQHVNKSAWTPLIDKIRKCTLQEDNERDKYAVNNQLYEHPKGGCTQQERYHFP